MDKKCRNTNISNFTYIEGEKTDTWSDAMEILIHTVPHWLPLAHFWLQPYSFSLLSMKSWILFIFSSCWSRRSMMMPMGVFFSPTPSILFSSLFFMLRSLREAWIRITTEKKTTASYLYFFKCENKNIHFSGTNLIEYILWSTSQKIRKQNVILLQLRL